MKHKHLISLLDFHLGNSDNAGMDKIIFDIHFFADQVDKILHDKKMQRMDLVNRPDGMKKGTLYRLWSKKNPQMGETKKQKLAQLFGFESAADIWKYDSPQKEDTHSMDDIRQIIKDIGAIEAKLKDLDEFKNECKEALRRIESAINANPTPPRVQKGSR
jgi:hypothetical protein